MISFDFETLRLERFKNDKKTILQEIELFQRLHEAGNRLNPLELYERAQKRVTKVEHGSGGYGVFRGYYCPSVYEPIAVGGCARGKVLKQVTKKSRISYEFCHGEKGLVMVKQFVDATIDVNEGEAGTIRNIEFIERRGSIELGMVFDWYRGRHELERIHVCQYDGDRLVNVREFLCDGEWQERSEIRQGGFWCRKEWLEYQDDRLKSVKNMEHYDLDMADMKKELSDDDDKNDDREMDEIVFIHNEDGVPIQYYHQDEPDWLYDVSKAEQKYYQKNHMGL